MSRRDILAGGMVGTGFGRNVEGTQRSSDADDDRQLVEGLRQIAVELQSARKSASPADVVPVGTLRDNMLQFLKSTNKWPDLIDVGPGVWFSIYDWHVRFGQQPAVTRLPDGRYGLVFMFTTLVLRQEQARDYMGVAYDKDR
jgi:hypothetical protein